MELNWKVVLITSTIWLATIAIIIACSILSKQYPNQTGIKGYDKIDSKYIYLNGKKWEVLGRYGNDN